MFSAQKLSTNQRREMILHLARHELRYLFIGLLILFISSTLFYEYILYSTKNEDVKIFYSNAAIDISSGVAFLVSLIVIKTSSERNDKSFSFLAIGLALWFSAELMYTYYQIVCGISVLYPTIADFIWIAGYFFLGAYFYKTIKIWHETKRVKLYSIVIASFIIAVLVGNQIYLNLSGEDDGPQAVQECLGPLQHFPLSSTIFDLSYYVGNGAILIPALVTLSNLRIRDPFFLHRILISIGVVVTFLFGDILFINYAGDFLWYDVFYNIGYICFALALIWYYKLTQLMNKNIDLCVKENDDLLKNVQQFIDKNISEPKEIDGFFENIHDANKVYDYLKKLLSTAKIEIQLLLSPMSLMYIVRNMEIYDLLLEKSKQPEMNIRILLPYTLPMEPYISRIKNDSNDMIKIQYIRHEERPNQMVLLVDSKLVLASTAENIGEKIDQVCRIIERENTDLDGVLTNTRYNDKRKYPDDKLRALISHFNSPRLRNEDLEKEDIFGDAYEYLLAEFADETKKKGGEFFTPREIVRLLVNLIEPKEGMSICDPTCGSGGMLIESRKYVERKKVKK